MLTPPEVEALAARIRSGGSATLHSGRGLVRTVRNIRRLRQSS